jgi:hypothetical protein
VEPIDLERLRAAVPGSTVGLDRLILVHALIILHSWSLLPTHIALALPAAALIPAAFACLWIEWLVTLPLDLRAFLLSL